jgi:hypothetical protein
MKFRLTFGAAALLLAGTAQGGINFYDLDGGGQAQFNADLATYGYTMQSATNWGALPDWGIAGMDGPVNTSTNNGIFAPGDIPFDLEFDSNFTPYGTGGHNGRGAGGNGLVAIGPSSGYTPSNGLAANYFVDSFDIFDVAGNIVAMELWTTSVLGGALDITAYDDNGGYLGAYAGISAPRHYGVLVYGPDSIGVVNVYDPVGGAEGVMGVTTYMVPAPGALALLGLAGLARRRRR